MDSCRAQGPYHMASLTQYSIAMLFLRRLDLCRLLAEVLAALFAVALLGNHRPRPPVFDSKLVVRAARQVVGKIL